MDNLGFGLQVTVLGLGIVFGLLIVLWLLLTLALRFEGRSGDGRSGAAGGRHDPRDRRATSPSRSIRQLVAAITVAIVRHADARRRQAAPGDAELLAGEPPVRESLGRVGPDAPGPELAEEVEVAMRRYTVAIDDRAFTIDVQETAADRFEVTVDGLTFEATLRGDHDLPGSDISPEIPMSRAGAAEASAPRRSRRPRRSAGRPARPTRPAARRAPARSAGAGVGGRPAAGSTS